MTNLEIYTQKIMYKSNNNLNNFIHNDLIEINIAGITFIFEIDKV